MKYVSGFIRALGRFLFFINSHKKYKGNQQVAHIFTTELLLKTGLDSNRQVISKHIKIIAECQLIKQEQPGREIYYHFNSKKLKQVDKWLKPFRAMWDRRFDQLDVLLKNTKNKKL